MSSQSTSNLDPVVSAPLDGAVEEGLASVPPIRRALSKLRGSYLLELGVLVLTAVIIAFFTPGFLSVGNMRAILESASITGIVAVTATMVTLSGNFFSLSTAQSAIFGAIFFAAMIGHGWNVPLAIVIVVVAVTGSGVVQGLVVAAGLNPIITTLAAGSIILGGVEAITHNTSVSMSTQSVGWLGIDQVAGVPVAVMFFVGVTVVMTWISAKTVLGRQTLLSGANRRTAEISGISISRVTIWAFAIAGFGAGLAGILTASEIGTANTTFFGTMTFDVVAAILVGGTAIQGGHGSPFRSAYGALFIAVINSAMLLHQFSGGAQQALEGALVLAIIIFLQSPVLRSLRTRRR